VADILGESFAALAASAQLIGDYEVFTLTGEDPKPINDWLGRTVSPFPPKPGRSSKSTSRQVAVSSQPAEGQ